MGPPLGIGGPEGAFQLLVSFSHQRVGSSILASLSEAGGYDLQKVASKPLPPRLSLSASRHLKRAYCFRECTAPANLEGLGFFTNPLLMFRLGFAVTPGCAPKPHCRFNSELAPFSPTSSTFDFPPGPIDGVPELPIYPSYRFSYSSSMRMCQCCPSSESAFRVGFLLREQRP
jgi:hypothetical protein